MELEILDEILEYLLFLHSVEKPHMVGEHERDNYFIKYDDQFFSAAINKLLKDQYIALLTNVKVELINRRRIAGLCDITFEGIIFSKSGGYKKQIIENHNKENALIDLQEEQRKQSKTLVNLNRWLVFGAIIVAIDSILNVLKFFNISFDSLLIYLQSK